MRVSRLRKKSLAHSRPKNATRPTHRPLPSSRASRETIKTHHQLCKAYRRAKALGDKAEIADVVSRLGQHGGLEAYQAASRAGQAASRGGDSSKVLVEWLMPRQRGLCGTSVAARLPLLEIGCLDLANACSRSGIFEMTRIDLNPIDQEISRQDFMERPIPNSDDARFAIVSLSLVLNYVDQPNERGEMLKRVSKFLVRPDNVTLQAYGAPELLPCLFLVLPAACTTNSRYLNVTRLQQIMACLGYKGLIQKQSRKLIYSLWRWDGILSGPEAMAKIEVNPGKCRNNFAIVLTS